MMLRFASVLLVLAACKDNESPKQDLRLDRSKSAPAVEPKPSAPVEQECTEPGTHICKGDDLLLCGQGPFGQKIQTCNDGCKNGACIDTCALQGVELVYVVDTANNLLSFDPTKLPGDPFHKVGELACDPSASPFSMAVDRRGVAWVLYENGKVFRVSIIHATCSRAIPVTGIDRPTVFGMGFVTNGPKSEEERMFVATNDDAQLLATLDTSSTMTLPMTRIGTIKAKQERNPELTGTGEGKLFGYFPETGPGFVQEIDRATALPLGPRMLVPTKGQIVAYAFAHWGGVFYIFATTELGNSQLHAINRKTGKHELLKENLPHRIVGAGVSTCAPLLERAP